MQARFLIRSAEPKDLPDLCRLARHLDSYNLPADRGRLARLLRESRRTFQRFPRDPARARCLFVLEDLGLGRVVGCSLIIPKHGTPGLPHLYLDSFTEKRTSRTLGKTVEHRCLRLGSTTDGPTEVGGLVLLPSHRGRPEKLGHWLSYVRFLYIAAHRRRFQDNLLVEFLPAFLKNGQSPFWEYFGRKFTGLSYRRADRLSIDNKEFVLSLFPRSTLYQDFFPKEVISHLGRVGDPTRPAARILEKIGFRYLGQIEPFDGGPYYGARTGAVAPVRRARKVRFRGVSGARGGRPHLLLAEQMGRVRALVGPAMVRGRGVLLRPGDARLLEVGPGGLLWATPFGSSPAPGRRKT